MSAPARSVPTRIWMTGHVRPSLIPWAMCTTGRRARWSIKVSPSKVATSSVGPADSSAVMAPSAPRPASTHPSSATTSTGRSRARSLWSSYRLIGPGSRGPESGAGGLGQHDDTLGEAVDARAVTGRGAADVAGVHPLEDAGELPVAEGHVEVEAADVAARRVGVPGAHLGSGGEAGDRRGR